MRVAYDKSSFDVESSVALKVGDSSQSMELTGSVTIETEAELDVSQFEFDVYSALRSAGLLKFENPLDDHPNIAITGAMFRSSFREAMQYVVGRLPNLFGVERNKLA